MASDDLLPSKKHIGYTDTFVITFYRAWVILQIGFAVLFGFIILENAEKPGRIPDMNVVPPISNLNIRNNSLYMLDKTLSNFQFTGNVLDVAAQNTPEAPETCMLGREGIPPSYKKTADFGNRQIVHVNETLISEGVCVNGTPTVTWGDALGCAKLHADNWAQFLCAPSSNHIALVCPTWDTIKDKECSVPTKCCKRTTGFIDGVEYFLEPFISDGIRYMTYIDKEKGKTLETSAGTLKMDKAHDPPLINSDKNCTFPGESSGNPGASWTCQSPVV